MMQTPGTCKKIFQFDIIAILSAAMTAASLLSILCIKLASLSASLTKF